MIKYNLEEILPHDHPMILIDDVININLEEKYVECVVTISEDKIFFDKTINGVSPLVGIEYMAQTIGCFSYFYNNCKKPKLGFLLGSRAYKNNIEKFENGKTYKITAKEIFTDNELVSFECFIYNGDDVCANATINTYLPKDALKFIEGM